MDITHLAKELGIDKLPQGRQDQMLGEIVAMLQLRVVMRLSENLTETQQEHLEDLQAKAGEEAAMQEIERIFPNYQQIVQEELEVLAEELRATIPSEE